MTISKESVTEKVTKDTAALKEVAAEPVENLEKLGKDAQQKVTQAVADTQKKLEAGTDQLNEQVQDQVQNFKQDLVQRLDVIKTQFSNSQKDLVELAELLKSELSILVKELTEVGKEIREDVSQISSKHKVQLTETLKRSKEHTLEVWHKVTTKQ